MKTKLSKKEAEGEISEFFKDIKKKAPKEVKKIKRLAMSKNIKLGSKRKLFCKKCLAPYIKPQVKTKNKVKSVMCEKCGYTSRWKIKKKS